VKWKEVGEEEGVRSGVRDGRRSDGREKEMKERGVGVVEREVRGRND
jgi:hypothetical protein